jgi:hypothetical protein
VGVCLFICLSVHLSVSLFVHHYICLYISLSICTLSACQLLVCLFVDPYILLDYFCPTISICLSVCLSLQPLIHFSICLFIVSMSVCLSICLFFILMCACTSICLSIYPFVCLAIHLSVYLSICLSLRLFICASIYLSVNPSVSLYVHPLVSLSVCPSVHAYVHLSICLSLGLSNCLFVCCLSVHLSNRPRQRQTRLIKKLKYFYFFLFRTKDATYNPDEGYVKMYIRGRPVQVKSTKNLYFKIKSRSR